jgi:hypothetical protein
MKSNNENERKRTKESIGRKNWIGIDHKSIYIFINSIITSFAIARQLVHSLKSDDMYIRMES